MDWEQFGAQLLIEFGKEGFNFILSSIKDKMKGQAKEKKEGVIEITQRSLDESLTEERLSISSNLNWEKVGTLFWLGNDLMWIQDMLYRGAAPERVIQGISIARKYTIDLGFPMDSIVVRDLDICRDIINSLCNVKGSTIEETQLLQQHYRTIEQYIQSIKWYLNALVQKKQPDFEKLRAL